MYLAYLDQLSPRDIQDLRKRGHKLPRLVHSPNVGAGDIEGNIWCGDFFADGAICPVDADLVVGNPPWGSTAVKGTAAANWCNHPDRKCPIPDNQIAAAFIWKSAHHLANGGRVCLVLPHGILFNHSKTAVEFQKTFFRRHSVQHVLNLADYQRFLFEEAEHPALMISYQKVPPANPQDAIEYWAPKADWLVTRAEIIATAPEDRSTVTVSRVLQDLDGEDAPQIWKQRYWATPRDWRLIDRLSLHPRLRDHVRGPKERGEKPWLMAEGFQPVGESDDPSKAKTVQLPSRLFIAATSPKLDLFLLSEDCTELPAAEIEMRSGSNKNTDIFRSPHVLVSKGFAGTAFAEFDVSFRHAVRGISGPKEDRDLLIFLAAFLRSPLAKYFAFHTSSNWGVSRQEVHVKELLRLPFPLPDAIPSPHRGWELVKEVAGIVTSAAARASAGGDFVDCEELVRVADDLIDPLINQYFDIIPLEKILIDDTLRITIPSIRPTRRRSIVPTIDPSKEDQRVAYTKRLCDTLNGWARGGAFIVQGHAIASTSLGIAVAILRKTPAGSAMELSRA